MNNNDRVQKLKDAEAAIRLVEFSYPADHPIRKELYRLVVNTFSFLGPMPKIKSMIMLEDENDPHP